MTTPEIIGYWVTRHVERGEVPSTMRRSFVGTLGSEDTLYVVPPGIDVLELGLISSPGRYVLIPLDGEFEPQWQETIDLIVTHQQALVQRAILERIYFALLAQIPHDADDVHAGVSDSIQRGEEPGLLNLVRRSTVEIWGKERRRSEPLDDAERVRLDTAVACHALAKIRAMLPRYRLDQESLRALVHGPLGCTWDRIFASTAEGDYDDAAVRVLARIKIGRKVSMPTPCMLQVLAGVERLDVCFLFLKHTSNAALYEWLQATALDDPAAAELAVRILFVVSRIQSAPVLARSMLRRHVPRIRCEPTSADARLIRRWLATTHKVNGAGEREMTAALERWDRALRTTVDEIIVSLPERAGERETARGRATEPSTGR